MGLKMPEKRSVIKEPIQVKMLGFEVINKEAKPTGSILVPKQWINKWVRVVRLDTKIEMAERKHVAKKPRQIEMMGFEVIEKKVGRHTPIPMQGRIYVPKEWAGKSVRVIRLED